MLTADGMLRAVGARLNVRQFNNRTELAVFDGRVALTPATHTEPSRQAHQQLSFNRLVWNPRMRWTPQQCLD